MKGCGNRSGGAALDRSRHPLVRPTGKEKNCQLSDIRGPSNEPVDPAALTQSACRTFQPRWRSAVKGGDGCSGIFGAASVAVLRCPRAGERAPVRSDVLPLHRASPPHAEDLHEQSAHGDDEQDEARPAQCFEELLTDLGDFGGGGHAAACFTRV